MLQLFITICFFFIFFSNVHAFYDPLSAPNNKYGIHVADSNDVSATASLVNSTGGDWGYVTLVIPDNDLNPGKWQEIFNTMRRKHLIPLVRIATHVNGDSWVIPEEHNISKWVDFLNSLIWPIENRYVILFNEPNHAKEWGGNIDPANYGDILIKFSQALRAASEDFFILPAGFDASAANDGASMDEQAYLTRMKEANPEVFTYIDGWTSHAYPNPAFSGSPFSFGRGTLSTFSWERELLKSFGVIRRLPIFITETGWQHNSGKYFDFRLLSPETVGSNLQIAASTVWNDKDIVAITPFLLNYQDYPFDHFSFKKLNSSDYYPHYFAYQSIPKTAGKPVQKERYVIEQPFIPETLVVNSTYTFETKLTNRGQAIVEPNNGFILTIRDESNQFDIFTEPLPTLEPNESGIIRAFVKTPKIEGQYVLTAMITHDNIRTPIEIKTITVVPPPSAEITVQLGWRNTSNNQAATVLVYDMKDSLLHKFTDVRIQNNHITVTGLYQIIPGNKYRVVVLIPYYLPRQEIVIMKQENNNWQIKRLYPFDFNRDGKLTLEDIPALLLMPPITVWKLFLHA
ncbi:MAG: hypothetical protein V1917_00100 [Candidatus Gottesmanbacteria bacterium]